MWGDIYKYEAKFINVGRHQSWACEPSVFIYLSYIDYFKNLYIDYLSVFIYFSNLYKYYFIGLDFLRNILTLM